MPFLKSIYTVPELIIPNTYPFTISLFAQAMHFDFRRDVTLFVGENGSGKSTLLEAIASKCDFHTAGGGRNQRYIHHKSESPLADALRLSWSPKVTEGFFLRAESFYNFATYLDEIAQDDLRVYDRYGGKSLHEQSHGESFLSLFVHRFTRGLFILDEPEAALSPQRQLAFMRIIHQLTATGRAQFIIATHSPMLLCYPGADVVSTDGPALKVIDYRDSEHYQLTTSFLAHPDRYFRHLFED
ncbi:MAG: AAA family ATPase [Chloroflexota bacterium]|jgi:predicted ATPase